MPLSAKSKEFLQMFAASGAPPLGTVSVPETRAGFDGIAAFGGPPAEVAKVENRMAVADEVAEPDVSAADVARQIAEKAGRPLRAAIDLVGNAQTAQLGFDCLTRGGKLVMVGLYGGGAPWALPLIPIKAITIQGSYVGNLKETQELLDLVRSRKVKPIPVTRRALEDANATLEDLRKGKLVGRAVLTP